MDTISNFPSGQIVALDGGNKNLYAEVIQVVVSRQLCWVRPLLMADFSCEPLLMTDLRDTSDLILPIGLFRLAVDTEVISLLSQLLAKEPKPECEPVAQQELHCFIQQLW
ncbi:hypothetical protein VB711_20630 [Cronbergia sp. UHCC 0137]|uniref:hypothetical protein n=1 Tax=Cronbergia sp. UHCC 0137 TaxID=3110239 RepID=UPI002B1EBF2C|nr:hypothetical protein [Cronbergia sp. UHCC 0137]MEA5620233.1 hypothetical protein [Cronbergia sp. UHCC 0137]